MTEYLRVHWQSVFEISQPILETVVRGSCMYLATFMLIRLFRRQAGAMGPADLLVLLLIADAAQNGLAGEYHSITDGIILVATIIIWEYALDWLSFHSKAAAKLLNGSPLLLVKNGQVKSKTLKSELMTSDDLVSQLRKKGIEDISKIKFCYLEGDGHVSVIAANQASADLPEDEANKSIA